ncbi:MAG: hypothetical protein OQK73_09875 [Gammaproteobacteria bacterium]|nr:hypothetical protein [Gammaproteobacteria bacterium]
MRSVMIIMLLSLQLNVHASETDWRKQANTKEKLKHLIQVIPSTSDIMFQMGERYKNFYWAAKQGKWEFTEYQMEEIQGLVRELMITRPKRKATAQEFLQTGFRGFEDAIKHKNWQKFSRAFENMRGACVQCHADNDHSFIIPAVHPAKGGSPALD